MSHKSARYKSDLTDEQWAVIQGRGVNRRRGAGRPVRLDLRKVVNGILFVVRTGCQWASVPHEYPNFNSIYYPDHKWCRAGTWEQINSGLRERVRQAVGRPAQPRVAIVDSPSVKTTEVGGEHGFDGGKTVNGRKRPILVDTMGNLLKVIAHAANIGERDGAKRLLVALPKPLRERLAKFLADGGYTGNAFQAWVKATLGVELEISLRPRDKKGFVVLPQRWVVERSLAWLGRSRRLAKDYEMLTKNSEGMGYLASIPRLLKHLAPTSFFSKAL